MILAADRVSQASWRHRVVSEITDATVAELPELGRDPELVAALRDSIDANARLFATMAERGEGATDTRLPPMAAAFARLLVHRGIPVQTLAQTYRIAHGAFWRTWVTELRAGIDDPAALADALEQGASYMFGFIDTLSNAAQQLHTEERSRWVRSADAVRAQTIEQLLTEQAVDIEAAGRRLRYDLRREHLAFLLWNPPGVGTTSIPSATDARAFVAPLRAGEPLLTPLGSGLLAGWVGRHDPFDPDAVAALSLDHAPGLLAAVGDPARGVDGFRLTHLDAIHARRVARLQQAAPGSVTHYATVAVTALTSTDPDQARRFVVAQLGALLGDDRESQRLAETLEVYLQERASPRRTAARLGVHENTVAARIHTAETRLGRPIEGRVTELLLALRLRPVALRGVSERLHVD